MLKYVSEHDRRCHCPTGQDNTGPDKTEHLSCEAPGSPADAAAEAGLAEKQGEADGWALHVVEPLISTASRKGLKTPRGWAEGPFMARLAEIGRAHGRRSVAELEAIRAAIRADAKAKGGRWPSPVALEQLVRAVLAKRKAETGGDSLVDAQVVERALAWWRRNGDAPPASVFDLRRRCRIAAMLKAGVTAGALRRAGHRVPDDLAGIGGGEP